MALIRLKSRSRVGWRVGDDLQTAILAGGGAGVPRRKFWGCDSVELIFCHYADLSRLGT